MTRPLEFVGGEGIQNWEVIGEATTCTSRLLVNSAREVAIPAEGVILNLGTPHCCGHKRLYAQLIPTKQRCFVLELCRVPVGCLATQEGFVDGVKRALKPGFRCGTEKARRVELCARPFKSSWLK